MISSIYNSFKTKLPGNIKEELEQIIEDLVHSRGTLKVFFRADDIGIPSKNFSCMMRLFLKYQTPLCLAVVPCWLTRQRWEAMDDFNQKGRDLFCWHMHGYRHINHEKHGKKFEFGQSRSPDELFNDLSKGYKRLESIIGKNLTSVFTPPWNRCSLETMLILQKLNFKGISRSTGVKPLPPEKFQDFPVHVDLHTRKEKSAVTGWKNLLNEFNKSLDYDTCGVMIHHMCMNKQAFILLEYFLKFFAEHKKITVVNYKEMI